jgi:hypothetical protein
MFDDILGPSKKKCGCKQCDGEDKRCNEEDKYCNGGDCEHKPKTKIDLSNVKEDADNFDGEPDRNPDVKEDADNFDGEPDRNPDEDEDLWNLDDFIDEENDTDAAGCIRKGRNASFNYFKFSVLVDEIKDYIAQRG